MSLTQCILNGDFNARQANDCCETRPGEQNALVGIFTDIANTWSCVIPGGNHRPMASN